MRLEEESANKYCFGSTTEAWSLAISKQGAIYMKTETEFENETTRKKCIVNESGDSLGTKGYDFSVPSASHERFNFATHNFTSSASTFGDALNLSNPFIFGTHSQNELAGNQKKLLSIK